jgi:hypothetical protein
MRKGVNEQISSLQSENLGLNKEIDKLETENSIMRRNIIIAGSMAVITPIVSGVIIWTRKK